MNRYSTKKHRRLSFSPKKWATCIRPHCTHVWPLICSGNKNASSSKKSLKNKSLIYKSKTGESLKNNRICLFSYGSGLASAMFSLLVKDSSVHSRFNLETILTTLNEQKVRLAENRVEIEPDMYDAYLQQREHTHKQAPRDAKFGQATLYPGTWFLKSVDEKYRRVYDKKLSEKHGEKFDSNATATHLNQMLSNF